jgi:hypothetical protein
MVSVLLEVSTVKLRSIIKFKMPWLDLFCFYNIETLINDLQTTIFTKDSFL